MTIPITEAIAADCLGRRKVRERAQTVVSTHRYYSCQIKVTEIINLEKLQSIELF